jgi:fatty acid kinase fatty acid binding subunit
MPQVAIVTDSSACLPADVICEYGIIVVPLAVHFDSEVIRDGEIPPDDFIQRLRTSERYPTTAAPAPGEFLDAFRTARAAGARAVLCLTLSSRYSGTYSSAVRARDLATQQLSGLEIRDVDTGGIAMAHGFAVLAAARAVRDGASLNDAAAAAERAGTRSNLVGLLDGTRYLAKSGRVPLVLHLAASALGIKPIIASTGGRIGAAGRVRTAEQGVERLVQFVKKKSAAGAPIRLAVMHAGAADRASDLAERARMLFEPVELLFTEFTPAMTVHTGPGFLGLAWEVLEPSTEPVAAKRNTLRRNRDVHILAGALGPLPTSVERPVLVMLSGLPGSGKSHLAREIVARHPLAVLNSDALRRALVKRPNYSQAESARLFSTIHALIEDLVGRGVHVLLDATNLKEAHRRPLREIAERAGARLLVVEVTAAEDVIRERLTARGAREDPADVSEATQEVYEMMRDEAEPIREPHIVVDASGDVELAVDQILGELAHERA